MSLLPAFLKLASRSSLLADASALGESSSTVHPVAASGGFSGQKFPLRCQPAPPDEDSLP
jgi:hypothetical protein